MEVLFLEQSCFVAPKQDWKRVLVQVE